MFQKIISFLFENKSDKQTILKNTFWLMLAEFLSKWSAFLITILIARILGPSEFGMLSFVMSFVAMFVVVTDFWLTTLMVREVSRDHSLLPSYLVNLSFLKVILGIITFLLVLIAASFLEKEPLYFSLILIYAGYAILNNIGEFLRAFFRPSESMQYEALLKSINGALMLAIVWGVLLWKGDLVSIMYGYLIAGFVSLCVSLVYVGKSFAVKKLELDKNLIQKSLKSGVFLMGSLLAIQLYVNSDQVILWFYWYYEQLWLYNASYKIIWLGSLIISLITSSLIPTLIKRFSQKKFFFLFRKILFIWVWFSIFNVFAWRYILVFLFGEQYEKSYISLLILLWTFVFITLNTFLFSVLNNLRYEKGIFTFSLSVWILNIFLNLFFIPQYQEIWAACTTLFAEIILTIGLSFFYRKELFLL